MGPAESFYLARYEAETFAFAAAGRTASEAIGGIVQAAMIHADEQKIPLDVLFDPSIIIVHEMEIGKPYRDGVILY